MIKFLQVFPKYINMGVIDMLEQFKRWASTAQQNNGNLYANGTINSYCTYLGTTIPNYINQETILNMNIDEIQHLINRLRDGDLNNWNIQQHSTPINSLRLYLRFLECVPPSRKQTTKNIILYGAPGVGKTHNTNKLIQLIEDGESQSEIFKAIGKNEHNDCVDISNIKDRVKFVTFHQSFGYEDFIEGFRPNKNGQIEIQKGIFHKICEDAGKNPTQKYYLVIDEINRGNISKIFGELITLIEEDKREKIEVTLPYSKESFKVPSNLFIIGTMNSTDKSIALIDIALRRRFTFLKLEPNETLVPQIAKNIFNELNKKIADFIGEDYQIGHSYFMNISNDDDLEFVLEYKITPLLEEYFYGNKEELQNIKEIIKSNH